MKILSKRNVVRLLCLLAGALIITGTWATVAPSIGASSVLSIIAASVSVLLILAYVIPSNKEILRLSNSLKELTDYKIALEEYAFVVITDPQGRIISVTDKFCLASQYSRQELLGQNHNIVNSGFHSKEFMRHLWTTISQGKTWKGEIKNRAKDGSFYWVNTTIIPFLDENGSPRQYVAIHADITERKHTELAYARLMAVVESSDDAIVSIDMNGIITTWNHGAENIYGYPATEAVGTSILELIPAHHKGEESLILNKAQQGEKLYHFETLRQTRDGRLIDVSITTAPLKDEAGKIVGIFKVARDITERKATEKTLQELNETLELKVADRTKELEVVNKELESFSYSVSHDLRAPLRGMAGFSQILKENYGSVLDEKGQQYVDRILAAADRMGLLIDDMLTLSQVARNDFKPQLIDLGKLANDIIDNLRQGTPDREVEFVVSKDMTTHGDPHLLKILLENLLGNAWKFTSRIPHAHIEFFSKTEGTRQIFCLQDNGAGFDMRYADKIFAPFQRLHTVAEFPGTGIGLAIVQRIVHRHSGRIWGQGTIDHGADFYFTIETA